MCRFIAYIGQPILIDSLLVKPDNSLINQSYDAEEMSQPLNGDGFGLGYYVRSIRPEPGLFRSITPAWSNHNLLFNASLIQTDCLFAHVRAASEGGITEYNCHPFHYEKYLMMHNGGVPQFAEIKRRLLSLLTDDLFLWIKGQTDSEHIFALIVQYLREAHRKFDGPLQPEQVADCFKRAFDVVEELKKEAGIGDELSTFNMMITDGERIFGTRYSSDPSRGILTLYHSEDAEYTCTDGVSRMTKREDTSLHSVLIVSEKLTHNADGWNMIPENHFIAVDRNLKVELIAL